jgi:probable rRNA maturation factor
LNVAAPALRPVAIANRHPRLRLNRTAVARVIHTLDAGHAAIGVTAAAIPAGELSLVFLTDPALAKLHADFLNDPTTTDVITFEGDPPPAGAPPDAGSAGEICVSVDTAERFAADHGHQFSEELTLYLVHGWLHLAGFDDLQPAKKRAMRRAEARALRWLRKQRAMPLFALEPKRPGPAARQKLAPKRKAK